MANNAPNFNVTDQVGQAPTEIAGAAAIQQAGAYAGRAAAQMGAADAAAITAVGTTGLQIAQGTLLAKEDKEIDAAVQDVKGRLLAVPGSPEAAQRAINAGGDHPAGQFKSDTDRLYAAWQQGVIDKTSFQLRLDGVVRKYSEIMPGWAKDFRSNAAERLGMSGIEHLLSANAQANQLAKDRYEASLAMDKTIAAHYGINDITKITPEQRSSFQQNLMAKQQYETIKMKRETQVMQDADNEKASGQQFALLMTNIVTGSQSHFQSFSQENQGGDINSNAWTARWAASYSSYLGNQELAGMKEIDRMMDPKQPNPITLDSAIKMRSELHTRIGAMQEQLKTDEGRNIWKKSLERAKGQAELFQDNYKIAHPQLEFYKTTGVIPKITDYYLDQGPEATKRKFGQLGVELDKSMKEDPNVYFNANLATMKGGVSVKDADAMHPGVGNLIVGTDAHEMKDFDGKNPQGFYDSSMRFASAAATTGPTGANNLDIAVNSGGLERGLKKLPTEQQQTVAETYYNLGAQNYVKLAPQVRALKEQLMVTDAGLVTKSKDPAVQQLVRDWNNSMSLMSITSMYRGNQDSNGPVNRRQVSEAALNSTGKTSAAAPAEGGAGSLPDVSKIPNAEVGGQKNPDQAKNPNSSASGRFQIIQSTWNEFKDKAAKVLGKKPEQMDIHNAKDAEAVAQLHLAAGQKNLADQHGITPDQLDDADNYALHHFGPSGGPKLVAARDGVRLGSLLSEEILTANKLPATMTVGEWRARARKRLNP